MSQQSTTSGRLPALTPAQQASYQQLLSEMRTAVEGMTARELAGWGSGLGSKFARATANRAGNLVRLARWAAAGTTAAVRDSIEASRERKLFHHWRTKVQETYADARQGSSRAYAEGERLWQLLREDPGKVAPELFAAVVMSVLVSGGPDGNGGAPDLDLMFGIDAHRSILSHSILMGSLIETGILGLLDLVSLVHAKLPAQRHPWWDSAHAMSMRLSGAAVVGSSLGMSYHMFVDGIFQPAAYHDLPVSAPMEVHQAIMTTNSVAEGGEVVRKAHASERPGAH